jgi:hypothetical protein
MWLVTQCYIDHGDIGNKKIMSFKALPDSVTVNVGTLSPVSLQVMKEN